MIVYNSTKGQFLDDVLSNDIENIIKKAVKNKLNKDTAPNEINSWKNSLAYMDRLLQDQNIPEDCGVAIEYNIPQTGKRIDFILTGQNELKKDCAVLIELKQWSEASLTTKDGVVNTRYEKGHGDVSHPSYQVWSYAVLLENFNEAVYKEKINLVPCAYLHNYILDNTIRNPFYKEYLDKAPVFLKNDALALREFLKKYVKYGDKSNIIFRIESGKIKASKGLADSIASMLAGNEEFIMIDDQKVVFETAFELAKESSERNKNVLIIEGGPGTGKSVIAVNLLVKLLNSELLVQYISKNAAPRAVYESKLTGSLRPTVIRNLFRGSGGFVDTRKNTFDALIVDEAHRLNEKSGLYGNLGENQIGEIIKASKFSVFFIDEDQRVTLNDIGEKDEIKRWAKKNNAKVHELELASQFRCNGSNGYLAWLDNILQIRETENKTISESEYEIKIFNSPSTLRDEIIKKNKINNKARLVAGYCWNWLSKKNPELFDIVFPEFGFKMKWNLTQDGSLWVISPESVNEIGCIHTCQGLEVDYVGVIVGPDLVIRNGEVKTNPALRARSDASTSRYKSFYQKEPIMGPVFVDRIIKNTYRTLMTRGMKGCYLYFTDKETEEYFRSKIEK